MIAVVLLFALLIVAAPLCFIVYLQFGMIRDLTARLERGPDTVTLATNTAVEAINRSVSQQVGQLTRVIDRVVTPPPPSSIPQQGEVRQGTPPLEPWYAGADLDTSDPTDMFMPDPGYMRSEGEVIGREETEPFGIPGLVSADVTAMRNATKEG